MTPIAPMIERPRLFVVDDEASITGPSLDDAVLALLADADHGVCLVCSGRTRAIAGGARCDDCGAEVVMGAASAELWAA